MKWIIYSGLLILASVACQQKQDREENEAQTLSTEETFNDLRDTSNVQLTYEKKKAQDLVAMMVLDQNLSNFLEAIQIVDLVDTLQHHGPFTVLAPTNGAFAKVKDQTLRFLMQPENEWKLKEIVKHHIIPGRIDLSSKRIFITLSGDSLFSTGDNSIDGVKWNKPVEASNGLLYPYQKMILKSE